MGKFDYSEIIERLELARFAWNLPGKIGFLACPARYYYIEPGEPERWILLDPGDGYYRDLGNGRAEWTPDPKDRTFTRSWNGLKAYRDGHRQGQEPIRAGDRQCPKEDRRGVRCWLGIHHRCACRFSGRLAVQQMSIVYWLGRTPQPAEMHRCSVLSALADMGLVELWDMTARGKTCKVYLTKRGVEVYEARPQ